MNQNINPSSIMENRMNNVYSNDHRDQNSNINSHQNIDPTYNILNQRNFGVIIPFDPNHE